MPFILKSLRKHEPYSHVPHSPRWDPSTDEAGLHWPWGLRAAQLQGFERPSFCLAHRISWSDLLIAVCLPDGPCGEASVYS